MNPYNGYTGAERTRKLAASYKVYPNRSHPCYRGPCAICGNATVPVEPHTEDYSKPYLWEPPAEYPVCRTCHGRLHKRFNNPFAWSAYKLHLKRGGFGADLKIGKIAREVTAAAVALSRGDPPQLPALRAFAGTDPWWDALTVNPDSLTGQWARPRQ